MIATGYAQEGNPPAFDPQFRLPVLEYAHGTGEFEGRSVTGGYVSRGPGGEQGQYFFADFRSNHLWSVRVEGGQAHDWRNRDAELDVSAGTFDQIASFVEDGEGRPRSRRRPSSRAYRRRRATATRKMLEAILGACSSSPKGLIPMDGTVGCFGRDRDAREAP